VLATGAGRAGAMADGKARHQHNRNEQKTAGAFENILKSLQPGKMS
jgi:hypothetical protein